MASSLDLIGLGDFDSEVEAYNALVKEGRKLEKIAHKVWNMYLSSYSPKEYIRSGNSQRAIKLKTMPLVVDGDKMAIELTWENDLAWHNSVIPNSNKKGHSIILISAGWHSKKLEDMYGRRVENHTYYEGFSYLSKVIQMYDTVRDKRVGLELEVSVKLNRPLK